MSFHVTLLVVGLWASPEPSPLLQRLTPLQTCSLSGGEVIEAGQAWESVEEVKKQATFPRPITLCRIPVGTSALPMAKNVPTSRGVLILFSLELERDLSPLALKGVFAHELAHDLVKEDLRLDPVELEYEADRIAARLVGAEVIDRSLREMERLTIRMLTTLQQHLVGTLQGRKERLRLR